ncbi:MAG: ATP-binding protein [Bacillota bacterium]
MRRILLLIAATILLSALLTTVLYIFSARSIVTQMAASNLVPRARDFSNLMTQYLEGNVPADVVRKMISDSSSAGASIHVFDVKGGYISAIQTDSQSDFNKDMQENYPQLLSKSVVSVIGGEEVVNQVHSSATNRDYIVVGIPITQNNNVQGAVLFTKPLVELNESAGALNNALFLSMLIAFAIMLFPAYLAARRMIRPINQMRDVALHMANGNYAVRADESKKGELGQLALAFNYLASQLSNTISSLIIERNRLRHTLDGLSEGIVAVDAKGRITHLNPAILKMFGHDLAAPPQERGMLIPDDSIWSDFDLVVQERHPLVRSLHVDSVVLRVSVTPLEDEAGNVAGAVGLFRDVTETERLEQMRRDYVANVSHELRTPVAGVRGLAEALHDGVVKSEYDKQRYYGYILRESMRLSRLIDDLLELSRLQSGSVAVQCAPVDVGMLLTEIGERYRKLIEEVGLAYSPDFDATACPRAWSNADRIEQVLVILLDNAVKYTPENGRVSIHASWDAEKIYVTVEDEGTGIAKEDLPHLFDRFYKSDKSRAGGGTGLGLSIAREVLGKMGETIKVESEEGKGSRFTFTLQREDARDKGTETPKP